MHEEIAPHPALAPFVDRFWISESDGSPAARPIMPDGCIDIIVDAALGKATVVGPMTTATWHAPRRNEQLIAVRFRPGSAAGFLDLTAHEIRDLVVCSDDLELDWLKPETLAGFPHPVGVAKLERSLLTRLSSARAPHPIVEFATRRLYGPHPPTIAGLEKATGTSRQHLARLFRAQVGVSPKRFARIARMQRALGELGVHASLAQAAAGLGYTDEAHMARDFRELCHLSPGQARAAQGSIFPIQSLLDAQ